LAKKEITKIQKGLFFDSKKCLAEKKCQTSSTWKSILFNHSEKKKYIFHTLLLLFINTIYLRSRHPT